MCTVCTLEFYKYTSIKIKIDLQKSLAALDTAKGINSLEFRQYSIFHTGCHDKITIERRFFSSSSRDATSLVEILYTLYGIVYILSHRAIHKRQYICMSVGLRVRVSLWLYEHAAATSNHWDIVDSEKNRSLGLVGIRCNLIHRDARTLVRSHTDTHIEVIDLVTRCLVNANTYKWRASCRSK